MTVDGKVTFQTQTYPKKGAFIGLQDQFRAQEAS